MCATPVLKIDRSHEESERYIEILTDALASPAVRDIMTTPLDVSPEPHPAMDKVRASFEPVWLGGATQSLAYSPGVRLPRRLCGRIVL